MRAQAKLEDSISWYERPFMQTDGLICVCLLLSTSLCKVLMSAQANLEDSISFSWENDAIPRHRRPMQEKV